MNKYKKIIDNLEGYICLVLMIVMLITCTIGVLYRYVLNNPLSWYEELCRICFVWMIFLGASYATTKSGHLYLDLFYSIVLKNHPKTIRICKTITAVIWVATCAVFAYYGMALCVKTVELSPALKVPLKYMYACVPVGMCCMIIRVIETTIEDWLPKKEEKNVLEGGNE